MAIALDVLPGEALLPEKPWLRRDGDTIVRFVRNGIAQNALLALSEREPGLARPSLDMVKNVLVEELYDLENEFGIAITPSEVEVDVIPRFRSATAQLPPGMGLRITSAFMPWPDLKSAMGDDRSNDVEPAAIAVTELTDRLDEYITARHTDRRLFMRDILRPEQFVMAGNGEATVTLVDVDPVFGLPTDSSLGSYLYFTQTLGCLVTSQES